MLNTAARKKFREKLLQHIGVPANRNTKTNTYTALKHSGQHIQVNTRVKTTQQCGKGKNYK